MCRVIKGENNSCLADSRAVLPVSSSALEKHLPFVSLEVALDSTPHLQTHKNKCIPKKQQKLAQGMSFLDSAAGGVREKSSSCVTTATGTSLFHLLGREVQISNNQNEREHHCSALCKWAAGFLAILGWGTWAAERTGGENEE